MRRNAWKHVFALSLAAMTALGAAGVASASARNRGRDFVGVWQLEGGQASGWGQQNGWNRRGNDTHYGNNGSYGGYDRNGGYTRDGNGRGPMGPENGMFQAKLPETFRIERDRRDFRIEGMDGDLIGQADLDGNRQLSSQQSSYGATVFETYSLIDNGHRLMVHTVFQGPRGTRQQTAVYDRA